MIQGQFLETKNGRIFTTLFADKLASQAILCAPPLFEEMNLSRAVIAKQAQYFAQQGYPTLLVDYLGTGDSERELDEVTIADWLEGLRCAAEWLNGQGVTDITLWGVRFGALLLLEELDNWQQDFTVKSWLLWKPVLKGKAYMSQFIRLKQANEMMNQSEEKTNWREHISQGNTTEIAGYPLSSGMLEEIDNLGKSKPGKLSGKLAWVEFGAKSVTPAMQRYVNDWPEDNVVFETPEASAFWQIPEIFSLSTHHELNLRLLKGAV